MWRFPTLILLVWVFSVAAQDLEDFDQTLLGFEFIFHDDTDLLLVVHDRSCYFVNAKDTQLEALMFLSQTSLEVAIAGIVVQRPLLLDSTLDEVRNLFEDRLADFHCVGKSIYRVNTSALIHTHN